MGAQKKKRPLPKVTDSSSVAVKTFREHKYFREAINGHLIRPDFSDISKEKEVCGYKAMREWLKYQQSYIIEKTDITTLYESIDYLPYPDNLRLPFPAVFISMEFEKNSHNDGHSMGFLVNQWDNYFNVIAFVDKESYYFWLDFQTVMRIRASQFDLNNMMEYCMQLCYLAIVFLSIYRKNPEVRATKTIRVGCNLTKKEFSALVKNYQHKILDEQVPDPTISPMGAFDTKKLISPCDRPEEYLPTSGMHQSPKEHWVKAHTRVYWTGHGRKTPVVREIKPFKRGKPTGELPEITRIYE